MGSRIASPLRQAGNIPGGGSAAVYLPRGDYTAVVLQNQCSSPGCLRRVPASFGSTGLVSAFCPTDRKGRGNNPPALPKVARIARPRLGLAGCSGSVKVTQ